MSREAPSVLRPRTRRPQVARKANLRTVRARTIHAAPRQSVDLPSMLLDQASMAVIATDLEGRITYLNRGAAELVGADAATALGRPIGPVVALPADGDSVDAIIAAVAKGDVWVGEFWASQEDGHRVPVALTVTPLRTEGGEVVGMIGMAVDNTQRHEAEADHARLAAAVEQTAESVMIADADASIVYVNPAFERASGYTLEEVVGQNPRILQSGTQSQTFYKRLWKTLLSGKTWTGELVNRRKDGTLFREAASITPVLDAAGELTNYVAVKRDITRLREIEATLDDTTEDRIAVVSALAHLDVCESAKETAHEIAVALLELPGIDRGGVIVFDGPGQATLLGYGGTPSHPRHEGDKLPPDIARYMQERARQGAWIERGVAGGKDRSNWALLAASGLRAAAYAPIGTDDVLGLIAIGTEDQHTADRMAIHLPMAVEFATTAFHLMRGTLKVDLESKAIRARVESMIKEAQFHPVFQPIVELNDGHAVGFEALTRFEDGTAPDQVFEAAAAAGLALDLEAATLEAAIAASERLPLGAWLSLNVSPALVVEGDILRSLLSVRSRPIVLEITEHQPIDDYLELRSAFSALGPDIRLAVDDAGAGAANFGHIVELRPHFVKIDYTLVRNVNTDLTRQALIVGMEHFAQATGCLLIAEGIETQAECVTLRSLGTQLGQGYLFGRPQSAPDLSAA